MSYAAAPALPRQRVALGRPTALLAVILAAAGLAAALPVRHAASPPADGANTSASTAAAVAALPLAAQLTMARTLAADLPSYALRATPTGAVGSTPAQHLSERFDRTGVTVAAGTHRLRLAVRTLSGGGATVALPAAAPATRANRVSYARGPVTEWFDNSALGLEQSFRVAAAPAAGATTLTLGLALGSPTLTARAAGRTGLALVDARGTTVLRYRGLVAHDARGRALPATMTPTSGGRGAHRRHRRRPLPGDHRPGRAAGPPDGVGRRRLPEPRQPRGDLRRHDRARQPERRDRRQQAGRGLRLHQARRRLEDGNAGLEALRLGRRPRRRLQLLRRRPRHVGRDLRRHDRRRRAARDGRGPDRRRPALRRQALRLRQARRRLGTLGVPDGRARRDRRHHLRLPGDLGRDRRADDRRRRGGRRLAEPRRRLRVHQAGRRLDQRHPDRAPDRLRRRIRERRLRLCRRRLGLAGRRRRPVRAVRQGRGLHLQEARRRMDRTTRRPPS